MYLMIGVFALSGIALPSDEGSIVPIKVVLDRSLYDENKPKEIAAAWLAYALARVNWVREHITPKHLKAHGYRRSFDEEFYGREKLVQVWEELKVKNTQLKDPYLDTLLSVYKATFLREYVWIYLRDDWWKTQPDQLQRKFSEWRKTNLSGHQGETLADINVKP